MWMGQFFIPLILLEKRIPGVVDLRDASIREILHNQLLFFSKLDTCQNYHHIRHHEHTYGIFGTKVLRSLDRI